MSTQSSLDRTGIASDRSRAGQLPTPLVAARLSFAAAALFLALLAALHAIKPEFDPAWRMISEYEIGRYGWVMALAFLTLALGCVAACVAIRPAVGTTGGKIGMALLLTSATGMAIAAVFTSDPITATRDAQTTHGALHGVGALLGIPTFPVAATLISLSLNRDRAWAAARRPLLGATALVWASIVLFFGSLAVLLPRGGGAFGPEVAIGWQNRLIMVANSIWLMAIAWRAARIAGREV